MSRAALALLLVLAGCVDPARGDAPAKQPEHVRHHMREHGRDLRAIERMLLAGQLENAKVLAHMLTLAGSAFGMPADARDVVLAAGSMQRARTLDQAIRTVARIAAACAACHARSQPAPSFPAPSAAPPDRPTLAAQMARHRWAVERAWEGLIGPSHAHWQAGLFALAHTNLPWARGVDQPDVALLLRRTAATLYEQNLTATAARAEAYGDLLATCVHCHTTVEQARARKADKTAAR